SCEQPDWQHHLPGRRVPHHGPRRDVARETSTRRMSDQSYERGERDARRIPWRAAIGVLLAVVTLALVLEALLTPAETSPAANQTPGAAAPLERHYAPEATLLDLSGNQVALSSFHGKVVILN